MTVLEPSGVAASNITYSSITFTWTAPSGFLDDEYEYSLSLTSDFQSAAAGRVFGTSVTLSNLPSDSVLYFKVRAVSGGDEYGDFSTSILASTDPLPVDAPASPANITVTNVTLSEISLSWTSSNGAVSYKYQIAPNSTFESNGGWLMQYPMSYISSNELTQGGLTEDTSYRFRIFSVGADDVCSDGTDFFTATRARDAAPTGIVASNITYSTITFSWNERYGHVDDGYEYVLGIGNSFDNFSSSYTGQVSSTTVNLTGLRSNMTHYFKVRGVSGGLYSDFSTVEFAATQFRLSNALPITPHNITVTHVSGSEISLSWAPSDGAVSYRYQMDTHAQFMSHSWLSQTVPYVDIPNNQLSVSFLAANSVYSFRIFAVDENNAISDGTMFLTGTRADIPQNIITTDIKDTSAIYIWDAVSGTDGVLYQYQVSTLSTFADLNDAWIQLSWFLRAVTVSSLMPNTTYYFRVRTVNSFTVGESSSPVILVTAETGILGQIPGVVTNAYVLSFGSTALTFAWSPPRGPITRYEYKFNIGTYSANSANWESLPSFHLDADAVSVTPSNSMLPDTPYTFFIRAINLVGSAEYTSITDYTRVAPPVVSATLTYYSILYQWASVSGASAYEFVHSTTPVVNFASVNWTTISENQVLREAETLTSYYMYVRAIGINGPGDITSVYSTTPDAQNPDSPTNLSAGNITASTITFSWQAPEGPMAEYQYALSTDEFFSNIVQTGSVTTLSVTLEQLNSNTVYHFAVKAVNTFALEGPFSPSLSARTLIAAPEIPFNITYYPSSTSLTFVWSIPDRAVSYACQLVTEALFDSSGGWNGVPESLTPTNTNSITFSSLTSNTAHRFRVYAINADGVNSEYGYTLATTSLMEAPGTPHNITYVSTPSHATFTWDPPERAVTYECQIVTNALFDASGGWGGLPETLTTTLTNSITFEVISNTVYRFRVFAVNVDNIRSGYNTIILGSNVDIPSNVRWSVYTNNSIIYEWDPVSGTDGTRYDYQHSVQEDFSDLNDAWNFLPWGASTSIIVSNIAVNTFYYFRVRAINSFWVGDSSIGIQSSINIIPGVPLNVHAKEITSSDAVFYWNIPTTGIFDSFTYQISTDSNFTDGQLITIEATGHPVYSVSVSNLSPNTVYYFRVRAKHLSTTGPFASTDARTVSIESITVVPSIFIFVNGLITNTSNDCNTWNVVDDGYRSLALFYRIPLPSGSTITSFKWGSRSWIDPFSSNSPILVLLTQAFSVAIHIRLCGRLTVTTNGIVLFYPSRYNIGWAPRVIFNTTFTLNESLYVTIPSFFRVRQGIHCLL
jgi:hypothetical protein